MCELGNLRNGKFWFICAFREIYAHTVSVWIYVYDLVELKWFNNRTGTATSPQSHVNMHTGSDINWKPQITADGVEIIFSITEIFISFLSRNETEARSPGAQHTYSCKSKKKTKAINFHIAKCKKNLWTHPCQNTWAFKIHAMFGWVCARISPPSDPIGSRNFFQLPTISTALLMIKKISCEGFLRLCSACEWNENK